MTENKLVEEVKEVMAPTPLTPEEVALAKRIANPDREWEIITEESILDYSLAEDPYKLPKEAAEMQEGGKFAFRWCEATSKRIDQLRTLDAPAKWWICNAVNTPFLTKHVDPVHGGVQKLDQILLFKPFWMHVAYQEAKMKIAKTKDDAGDIKNKDGLREEWGEWRSGDRHKIGNRDQVMADFETYEE